MFSIELQDFAQIVILCHLFAFSPLVFISYDVTILLFQIAVTCLIPPWDRLTFLRLPHALLWPILETSRFVTELENFWGELFFGDFSIFLLQAAGCAMWGSSGSPQDPIFVIIGKIGDSGINKSLNFISQRGATTCTLVLHKKTEKDGRSGPAN